LISPAYLRADGSALSAASPDEPILQIENLSKTFGGAKALDAISFSLRPGEVHGLLGKNGSGKSTLVKVLAGFHAPDPGARLAINGHAMHLPLTPGEFRRLGLSFVHQNLGLVPSLSVLENLRIAELVSMRHLHIDWRRERQRARTALERFGLDMSPDQRVDRLSPVDRALLAIVRAFEDIAIAREEHGLRGVLVLDEPTPFLPSSGVAQLFDLVRRVVEHGSSVIFISHDIDEVKQITDRITVLRDGRVAAVLDTAAATHEQVIEAIVGRRIARAGMTAKSQSATSHAPFAHLTGVEGRTVRGVDIDIGRGEILGLTGLIGSGYEEIPYLAFGASKAATGTMTIEGETVELARRTPKASIAAGLALLPGDRQGASGVDSLPVADNMLLPDLDRFFSRLLLNRAGMRRRAAELSVLFEVHPNNPGLNLSALSGGNAQKVLIARWMNRQPKLLLLDEPTQGVDVGTREQVFAALRRAAADGMSIVCASSDFEQLAEICDRVHVFARGRICATLTGASITKDGIADACFASLAPPSAGGPSSDAAFS
jgi:ribose transport system ATP-binding protein